MKQLRWVTIVLAAMLLAAAGPACKQAAPAPAPQSLDEGVARLRTALLQASPQVQSNLYSGVIYGIRYGRYLDAMTAMDQVVNDPSLTVLQKKLAGQVIDLLKQKVQQ